MLKSSSLDPAYSGGLTWFPGSKPTRPRTRHVGSRDVTADFGDRILPVTTAVCERWARLNVPDPDPVIDGLLAATAIESNLVLVTRNTSDVERTGVALHDPFTLTDLT